MIYAMTKCVAASLAAKNWPAQVRYGKERVSRATHYSSLVVIERDTDSGDSLSTAHGQVRNARKLRTRSLAVRASVFAKSPKAGARVNEHEHELEDLVDAVIVAVQLWATESRAGDVDFHMLGPVDSEEHNGSEIGAGAAYDLRFRVQRAVTDRVRDTATLSDIDSAIIVSAAGGDSETVD